MASGLYVFVFLCLTSGLWTGANAHPEQDYEEFDDRKHCSEGWTEFGDICYMFHSGAKNLKEAEAACVSSGGSLASVSDQDQYNFLKGMSNRDLDLFKHVWMKSSVSQHQRTDCGKGYCLNKKPYICAKSL